VTTIPSVGITQADGQFLKANRLGQSANVNVGPGNYAYFDGTSMATPHVSAIAALVWSHFPTCTNANIRNALNATAEDLGAAGRDSTFGYGLVRTKAAVDYLTLNGCSGGGGGTCKATGTTCSAGSECCSGVCSGKGKNKKCG